MQLQNSDTELYPALYFTAEQQALLFERLQKKKPIALLAYPGFECYKAVEGLLLTGLKSSAGKFVLTVDFRFCSTPSQQFLRLVQDVLPQLETDYLKLSREILSWLPGVHPEVDRSRWEEKEIIRFSLAASVDLPFLFRQLFAYLSQKCKHCVLILRGAETFHFLKKGEEGILNSSFSAGEKLSLVYCFETGNRSSRAAIIGQFSTQFLIVLSEPTADQFAEVYASHYRIPDKKRKEAIEWLAEWCFNQPDQVYNVFNRMNFFKTPGQSIGDLNHELRLYWKQLDPFYRHYYHLLTERQWSLARAIALENGVRHILSATFIQKYQLGGASTVKVSLSSLEEKEIVREEQNGWILQDGLWRRWFREQQ